MDRRKFFKNISATIVGVVIFPGVVIKVFSTRPGFNIKKLNERIKYLRSKHGLILPKPRRAGTIFIPPTSMQPINQEFYEEWSKRMSMMDLLKIIDK